MRQAITLTSLTALRYKIDGDNYIDTHYLTLAYTPKFTRAGYVLARISHDSADWSNPVSFKILRQPVKSSASSLQLPAGAVVDLDFSGTDYQSFYRICPAITSDVAVIFSRNGSVEGYYWNNQPYPALGPIFMLIGSRSRVRDFVNSTASGQLPILMICPTGPICRAFGSRSIIKRAWRPATKTLP